MGITAAQLMVKIGADTADAERGLQSVSDKLSRFGEQAQRVGMGLSVGITAPLTGAGLAVWNFGVGFESAFAGVRKTVDATDEQLATLRQGIRDMAGELPASTTEISAVAEAAGQLGIETDNILEFTRTMVDLGVATNLSGEQAATALARLANITQMPQTEFDNLGATVVDLGNNLATTEAEIVEMGLRIAGAGSQIGLTEAEILGFAGALSSVGIEAQAGGTAISRVMIDMAQTVALGGEKLDQFAAVAGMTADEFATAFKTDAAGAVITFVEGLGQMSSEGENVFGVLDELSLGEIRVRDALLRASGAGDLFRKSIALGSDAWAENTALTKEAEQRYGTVESRLKMLMNRASNVAITLYDKLRPTIVSLLDAGGRLVEWISGLVGRLDELDPAILTAALAFGAILAAAGPVLLLVGTLATALGALLSPIGLIVLAIAALAAAWATNFMGIRDITTNVFGAIQGIIEAVLGVVVPFVTHMLGIVTGWVQDNWPLIQKTIDTVMNAIQWVIENTLGAIAAFWQDHGNRIMAFVQTMWTIISTVVETAIRNVLDILKVIMQLITGDWEGAWETIKGILGRTWEAIQTIVGAAIGFVWEQLLKPVLETIQTAWENAWDAVGTTFSNAWNGIVDTAKSAVNAVIGFINDLIGKWNAIELSIPGFNVDLPGGGSVGWGGITIGTPDLPLIPTLDAGGIITGPTIAALAMNNRPEAVVPLDNTGGIIDYERMGEAVATALAKRPTYQIDAHYRYQDERDLKDDLRLLQMLGATV